MIKEIFESADGEPGVSTSTTHAREIEKVRKWGVEKRGDAVHGSATTNTRSIN